MTQPTHPAPPALATLLRAAPAWLLLAPMLAGCGGAAPEAVSPSTAAKEEASTVEGATAAVDRAERNLDQLLPRQSSTLAQQAGAGAFATPPSAAPSPPQPPPPPPPAASAVPAAPPPPAEPPPDVRREAQHDLGGAKKAGPASTLPDACSTACSALASMTRAADHLCSLTGAGDARCASARTRVTAATARVQASCPACGGG